MPFKTPGRTSEYIRSILPAESDRDLAETAAYADRCGIAVLLPETAVFLKQLACLRAPLRILEIGTAVGYSGLILLKFSGAESRLFTVEKDEACIRSARAFFDAAGVGNRVKIYAGEADEIVPMISGKYDFVFMDGPKAQYVRYLPFLSRALSENGLLVCDNVLFNGMVSGEKEIANHKGGLVKRLDEFLHALMLDGTLLSSVLPVGDGVSVSVKRTERADERI